MTPRWNDPSMTKRERVEPSAKVCPVCHTEKPLDAFAKYGHGDHLRRRQCKACWSKLVYARFKARRQATTKPV